VDHAWEDAPIAVVRPVLDRSVPVLFLIWGVLAVSLIAVPGMLKPDWWAAGAQLLICGAVLIAAAAASVHPFPPVLIMVTMLIADAGAVLAAGVFADPPMVRITVVWFAFPTAIVALLGRCSWLVAQALAALAGTVVVLRYGGETWPVVLQHTAVATTAATGPAVVVLMLLDRLTGLVHRERGMAITDPLTGLANRRGLEARAVELLRISVRTRQALTAVALDLDHFKRVNDRYGHAVGDQVLQRAAEAIQECVRPGDVVVRLGGEEFAVVAVMPQAEAAELGERIRAQVAEACAAWSVTASLGVAWLPDPEAARLRRIGAEAIEGVWALVARADALLMEAKRAGRNRVVCPAGDLSPAGARTGSPPR
jgi:diguanylate cyclase (GGDEF)-like protein